VNHPKAVGLILSARAMHGSYRRLTPCMVRYRRIVLSRVYALHARDVADVIANIVH
jgi:hypothetical protein